MGGLPEVIFTECGMALPWIYYAVIKWICNFVGFFGSGTCITMLQCIALLLFIV